MLRTGLVLLLLIPLASAGGPDDLTVVGEGVLASGAVFLFDHSGFNGGCGVFQIVGEPARGACVRVIGGALATGTARVTGDGISLQGRGPELCPSAPSASAFTLTGSIDGETAVANAQIIMRC